jgi:hypothetical protein
VLRAFAQQKTTVSRRVWAVSKVAGVAILSLNVPAACGQAPPPIRPQFEVASVKPHSSSQGSLNAVARDPGLLTYTGFTVRGLIREAYGLKVYPLTLLIELLVRAPPLNSPRDLGS